jgi:hypothetical protein
VLSASHISAELVFGMFKRLHGRGIPVLELASHFAGRQLNATVHAFGSNRRRDMVRLSKFTIPQWDRFRRSPFAELRPSVTRIYQEDLNDPLKQRPPQTAGGAIPDAHKATVAV